MGSKGKKGKKPVRLWLAPVGDDLVVDVRPLYDSPLASHMAHVQWFEEHGVSLGDLVRSIQQPNWTDPIDRDQPDHHEDGDRVQRFFYVKGLEGEENFMRCMAILKTARERSEKAPPEVVVITAYPYPRKKGPR